LREKLLQQRLEGQHRDERDEEYEEKALLVAGFLLRIFEFCQSLDFPQIAP
jgi:hypothetical protein